MKHIAKELHVSVMTVSLALRQHPSIPVATRERVLAAAKKLGYRRNPLISTLMASLRSRKPPNQSADVIAYVESFPKERSHQEAAILAALAEGARRRAAMLGYRLELFHLNESELNEHRLEHMLRARGIRGVVFAPFPIAGSTLHERWQDHALAAIGHSLAHPTLHRAINYQAHSMQVALTKLLELGYKTIGIAIPRHQDDRVEHIWLSSILLAQHEHKDSGVSFPFLKFEKRQPKDLSAWLKRCRPEVVISTERELYTEWERLAVLRGRAVAFIHMHLTSDMTGCTGIDQNDRKIAAAAVDLVVEQLYGNQFGIPESPKTVLIEGRWVAGETATGPDTRRPRQTLRSQKR